MQKTFIFLIAVLFTFQSCRKDDGVEPHLTPDTGLDITWLNKPDDNHSGNLRVEVYTSESDYVTPFAKPLYDTILTQWNEGPTDRTWRATYMGIKPGTYWVKLFSVNEPNIVINSNDKSSGKIQVVKDKMNAMLVTTTMAEPVSFNVHKITINKTSDFLQSTGVILALRQYYAFNTDETKVIYSTATINTNQLPYTIQGLNIPLNTKIDAPAYSFDFSLDNYGFGQYRVDFYLSLLRARVFDDKIYIWNANNEILYVFEGEWKY